MLIRCTFNHLIGQLIYIGRLKLKLTDVRQNLVRKGSYELSVDELDATLQQHCNNLHAISVHIVSAFQCMHVY